MCPLPPFAPHGADTVAPADLLDPRHRFPYLYEEMDRQCYWEKERSNWERNLKQEKRAKQMAEVLNSSKNCCAQQAGTEINDNCENDHDDNENETDRDDNETDRDNNKNERDDVVNIPFRVSKTPKQSQAESHSPRGSSTSESNSGSSEADCSDVNEAASDNIEVGQCYENDTEQEDRHDLTPSEDWIKHARDNTPPSEIMSSKSDEKSSLHPAYTSSNHDEKTSFPAFTRKVLVTPVDQIHDHKKFLKEDLKKNRQAAQIIRCKALGRDPADPSSTVSSRMRQQESRGRLNNCSPNPNARTNNCYSSSAASVKRISQGSSMRSSSRSPMKKHTSKGISDRWKG